jgi:two-component system LytT family response regulator
MKNNNYTVVIIDDETLCIDTLCHSLNEYPEILIVGTAKTSLKGRDLILVQRPDLVFLDVELSGQSGLELLDDLNEEITWPMQVVFYTAFDKYLLEALRVSAFDYLLKPFEQEEISLVLSRFFNQVLTLQAKSSFQTSMYQMNKSTRIYLIATITGFQKLRLDQIGYFEYQKDKKQWIVVLTDHSRLQLKRNTKAEDIINYSSSFIQINQNHIINLDYLSNIDDKICKLFPPFHKEDSLVISRTYLKTLQEKYELI